VQADPTDESMLVGETFNLDVSGLCTDPDGDTIGGGTLFNTAVTLGQTTITNGWLTFASATQIFSGTPTVAGTYSIQLICEDQHGLQDTQTFDIVVDGNLPPVYTPIADQVFNEGDTLNIASGAAWNDPDGDATTFSCVSTLHDGSALPATLLAYDATTKNHIPGSTDPIGAGEVNSTYQIQMVCSDDDNSVTGTFNLIINDLPVINVNIPD